MSVEENKRLFAHYTALSGGSMKTGNPIRDELIVSDAKKHLADLVKKNPELEVKEEPAVEEEVKSKDKK